MSFKSFKQDGRVPPARYRTPSPPRRDVSPCSPHTFEGASPSTYRRPVVGRVKRRDGYNKSSASGSSMRPKDDSRMDALASIILGAQPDRIPPEPLKTGQQTMDVLYPFERPLKRPRSEKLPSPDVCRGALGQITSYAQSLEVRRADAELLLNFSREACFKVPRSQTANYNPSSLSINRSQKENTYGISATPALTPYRTSYIDGMNPPQNILQTAGSPEATTSSLSIKSPKPKSSCMGPGSGATHGFSGKNPADEVVENSGLAASFDISATAGGEERALSHTNEHRSQNYHGSEHGGGLGRDEYSTDTSYANGTAVETKDLAIVAIVPVVNDIDSIHNLTTNHTELDHSRTNVFLAGIEEAARGDHSEAAKPRHLPPATHGRLNTMEIDSPSLSATKFDVPNATVAPKGRAQTTPSVCAACNFSRNSLTLDTENDALSWISCDACKSWFHFACAGFKSEREVRGVDKYRCRKCKPIHGNTTYVRKSARAHSAIDYAGLNEGVLKTSDENPEHHYIKPIKDGIIKFNPESFARMRPELVTADYFQKGDGMKEPIVIPVTLNPRPRPIPESRQDQDSKEDDSGTETQTDVFQDQSVLEQWLSKEFEYQTVLDHGQDALDMVIPQDLTVRKVSELYGPEEKVEVIDVKSQNGEDKKWNMRRWVDYYESKGNKVVRNVISLEVSQSKLGRLIKRPKVVRDLDLQDSVWPADLIAKGDYPKVQFYCLMSVADCFTDFHIDFGGSSVFYHILKGKKTFFFIPPHEKHLKKYEEWCMSPAQNWTFLGDQTKECYRVDLSEGDTMLIPAGWIHAVWTPEDSLVIGGNFLTRMHYEMQIRIAQIEKATGVARKFRYPHFQKLLWYTAMKYLDDDPLPDSVVDSLLGGQIFQREMPTYLDFDAWGGSSNEGPENFNARYYSKAELDGLPELGRYLQRTALIAMGNITEGISVETRNAVKRSIPKVNGEPLELVKKFAIWYTWKRGNEPIPHWAYPDHVPEGGAPELTEKKLSAAALRRLDREAALQAWRIAPDRQSTRRRSQPLNLYSELTSDSGLAEDGTHMRPSRSSTGPSTVSSTIMKRKLNSAAVAEPSAQSTATPLRKRRTISGVGPPMNTTPNNKGPACETCRKRRRACKHRGEMVVVTPTSAAQELAEGMIVVDSSPIAAETLGNGDLLKTSNKSSPLNGVNAVGSNSWHSEHTDQKYMALKNLDRGAPQMSHVEVVRPNGKVEVGYTIANESTQGYVSHHRLPSDTGFSGIVDVHSSSLVRTPGRTKACKDCRKSKRRCIHDENGNEDPVKVAEASVPRSSSSKKRKTGGEAAENGPPRKMKRPSTSETMTGLDHDHSLPLAAVSPALRSSPIMTATQTLIQQSMPEEIHTEVAHQALEQSVPTLTTTVSALPFVTPRNISPTPQPSPSPNLTMEDEVHLIATSPISDLKFETDYEHPILSSNPSFQQPPASSLVSPPASTHNTDEDMPPAKIQNVSPSATSSSSRHSSRPATTMQHYTPESGSIRRASCSSVAIATDMLRESKSPGLGTSRRSGSVLVGEAKKGRKSRVGSEIEADEESMRLIRELQAQDMGLRRRGRV
ncbi:JmjC domain-containing histone demethylation protein 1 [Xylographa trunciseda]|nr:JmjC domain-containing histone demethylation protein 1 [Xylographa trunciseda]